MKASTLAIPALLLAGCLQVPPQDATIGSRSGTGPWETVPVEAPDSVLYARDGTPLAAPQPGPTQGRPARALEDGESRLYLLELYQAAMDEKDDLNLAVEQRDAEIARLDKRVRELEARQELQRDELQTLELETRTLHEQNKDLAGRLTTAQIRRLEAEKLLLEATLEWERLRQLNAAASGMPDDESDMKPVEKDR